VAAIPSLHAGLTLRSRRSRGRGSAEVAAAAGGLRLVMAFTLVYTASITS